MKPRPYEFRNASGTICCSTNDPDKLCGVCKAKLVAGSATTRNASLRTNVPRRVFRISQPRREPRKTEGEWRDHFGRRIQGFGSVVVEEAPPDPYAGKVPAPVCPRNDKAYEPFGMPADPYQIALDRRKL